MGHAWPMGNKDELQLEGWTVGVTADRRFEVQDDSGRSLRPVVGTQGLGLLFRIVVLRGFQFRGLDLPGKDLHFVDRR